jgi:FimV-like protein
VPDELPAAAPVASQPSAPAVPLTLPETLPEAPPEIPPPVPQLESLEQLDEELARSFDEPDAAGDFPRPAAVAGSRAAKFGVLDLDFDVDLPDGTAALSGMSASGADFDPVAIDQNKLELAHEYVALGDVAGARALINEVIASNDPSTRDAARTLLASLAPLS